MSDEVKKDVSIGVRYVGDKHVSPMFVTDSYLTIFSPDDIDMPPGVPVMIKTGVVVDIPEGFEASFRPTVTTIVKHISLLSMGLSIESGEHEVVLVLVNQSKLQQMVYAGEEVCRLAFIKLSSGEVKPLLDVTGVIPTLVVGDPCIHEVN